MTRLEILESEVIECVRCPRLVAYRAEVARVKRRAFREWTYWGKPVPGFGDAAARLLIIGLAPAAHGGNRTGRVFTGDRSGDFLYKALYDTGFASQPESVQAGDGLKLRDAFVTASVRCAPPDNKPTPEEFRNCRSYLEGELALLTNIRVVVALGKLAFDNYLVVLQSQGRVQKRSAMLFGHGCEYNLGAGSPVLIGSYHPSQQNTQTGRLTEPMFRAIFERANELLADSTPRKAGSETG